MKHNTSKDFFHLLLFFQKNIFSYIQDPILEPRGSPIEDTILHVKEKKIINTHSHWLAC